MYFDTNNDPHRLFWTKYTFSTHAQPIAFRKERKNMHTYILFNDQLPSQVFFRNQIDVKNGLGIEFHGDTDQGGLLWIDFREGRGGVKNSIFWRQNDWRIFAYVLCCDVAYLLCTMIKFFGIFTRLRTCYYILLVCCWIKFDLFDFNGGFLNIL